MEVFLGRQKIFDRDSKIIGYELLFRNGRENYYNAVDHDSATVDVIKNTFLNIGIEKVTGGKKAFINFTENLLKTDIIDLLPPELVVVEILETVLPSAELLSICKDLKKKGYTLALDDFVFSEKYNEILDYIDIIKIDFKFTLGQERKDTINKVHNKKIKFLAEKIETDKDFNEVLALGYSYFQGYYLSKPAVLSSKEIPKNKVVYLKLLSELNKSDISIDDIETLIKKDIYLLYSILKYMNSAKYGFIKRISSIRQAVVLIGELNLKKLLNHFIIKSLGDDKASTVLVDSLTRARFCELVITELGYPEKSYNAYLTGLLSCLDVLLERPLEDILKELMLSTEVTNALLGKSNSDLSNTLLVAKSYESSKWRESIEYFNILEQKGINILGTYFEALRWAYKNVE